ncbi:cation-translocating P-type ATPase [Stappia indica]|uniref:cation-translocating P-type ATPase n=1 Tax=Stappia indica TaxID=538381 RepID=UPI001CD285CA|nr:cation-transporting P-type ATPase [Stappia indica]MCA1297316.1 cation-transporting P-type ATPase [Stappia indica]
MVADLESRSTVHADPPEEVLRKLGADADLGLSAGEAQARQRHYGKNAIARAARRGWLSLLLDQFRSVIVWLLAGAAAVSILSGDLAEAIAILSVLVINTAIGFTTSLNAIRSMEALFRMTAVTARARRDGRSRILPVQNLTPGDIVILESGDTVPADLRLLDCADLRCNESALTGESAPISKSTDALAVDTVLHDRTNMAFKGTAVMRGTGIGVVAMIGPETEVGRIAELAQSTEADKRPLEKRLDRLGETLVWVTVALSALIALAGYLHGLALTDMAQTAIALAVAAVPEGLPVVATLALARGMLRLARRNALIERLAAVETLGATTIILTDKTGTLTENRMEVSGYLLHGHDVAEINAGAATADPLLKRALEIGALCNTAELGTREQTAPQAGVGDPMEVALLQAAEQAGVSPAALGQAYPLHDMRPFDPDTGLMVSQHSGQGGGFAAIKGVPERVLREATRVLTETGVKVLTEADRADWLARIEEAARRGFRLIGLAFVEGDAGAGRLEEDLVLVGFVRLLDPLRADVPAAIRQSRGAGVRVVMMTGDHPATATEIARQAGLGEEGAILALSGRELAELGSDTADRRSGPDLMAVDVFARVSPETKLRLVEAYQSSGHVVAMTGDGVNDAPALKKADIGVAMGQRGTQVARDAADMILRDDAFASIIAAMRQGRVIFSNIRRFVIYLMSCNFSEILVVGLAIAAGLPAPLLPLQILFLNLVTDVFPAFALGLGEGDRRVMKRPPRSPEEPIIGRVQWLDIVVFGLLVTLATLSVYWAALHVFELASSQAVTIAFLALAVCQLLHVFNMRARDEGRLRNSVTRNPFVWAALGVCAGLLAAAFYLPGLSDVMALQPLHLSHLALPLCAGLAVLGLGQVWLAVSAKRRSARRIGQRENW